MPSGFSPADYEGGIRGPTPASYSAPLQGQAIGAQIAGLPAAYQQGQQFQLATALRTAFPDGLPQRPDGSIDAMAITNKIASIGGLDQSSVGPLMNLAARQSLATGDQPPGATAATPQAPPAPPTARSMLGLSAPMASNDATGDVNTIRGVATEVFGDTDVSHLLPRYSAALKVADADAPLSQDQITVARRLMGKSAAALRAQPSQSPVASDEGVTQRAGSTFSSDYAYNGGAGTPTSSGVSGSPGPSASGAGPSSAPLMSGARAPQGPQAGQPGTQPAAPAAGGGTRMAQAATAPNGSVGQPGRDPAAGLVPAGLNMSSLQYATWLQHRAMAHSQAGDKEGADLFQKAAQPILDALKQAGEIPPEMKIAASQGMTPLQYEGAKTQQGKDIDVYTKLNTGVQALANTSAAMRPTLDAATSLLNAGAATGWHAEHIQTAQQILARIGGNPNGAMNLEAFGKQMAAFINQQTNTLKADSIEMGGSSMRIFANQIENMQKASPSLDYTPAGNRYLVEVYRRGIDRAVKIADLANNYKGGHLDAGFQKVLRDEASRPMFTEAEIKDPRRVAPPTVGSMDDARRLGVRKGDFIKFGPTGEIGKMP
jgi:hypothetical protein